MNQRMTITICLMAGVGAAAVGGCSGSGSTFNHPFKKYTKEEQIAATAARGYEEIARDKVIYVVSTHEALKRVREGGEPAMKVAAIGFGPNGEKVIFEASKEGLEEALMKEFERRHGARQS